MARSSKSVLAEAAGLTERQLLVQLVVQQTECIDRIKSLEALMAELSEAVSQLQVAVDGVAQRLLPRADQLEAALAETQSRLEAALADDEQAASLMAEATQAAADIRAQVDELNALGADPSTPVEPTPEEPTEPTPEEPIDGEPTPVDENPPTDGRG